MRKPLSRASGRNDAWFAAACILGLSGLGLCSEARAQDVSANVAVTSDYVFRGVSQTQEKPAISAGVDLTNEGFYAGAWASNVDFGDSTDAEVDLYAGYRPEVAGYALDVGVVGYLYPGQPEGADYDYVELKAAASRAVGPATLGAAVYYSPDFFGAAEDQATYAEINGAVRPADKWDDIRRGRSSVGVFGPGLYDLEPGRGLSADPQSGAGRALSRHRPARLRRRLWRARRSHAESRLLRRRSWSINFVRPWS